MSPGVMDELRERAGRSVLLRMLFIGFLILVLQIPILTIDSTVSEREATRQGAIAEVTRTWGGAQQVAGPVLTVPYLVRSTDDKGKVTVRTAHASFLPRTGHDRHHRHLGPLSRDIPGAALQSHAE